MVPGPPCQLPCMANAWQMHRRSVNSRMKGLSGALIGLFRPNAQRSNMVTSRSLCQKTSEVCQAGTESWLVPPVQRRATRPIHHFLFLPAARQPEATTAWSVSHPANQSLFSSVLIYCLVQPVTPAASNSQGSSIATGRQDHGEKWILRKQACSDCKLACALKA